MMLQPKTSKTCDECKSRKVRCVKEPGSDSVSCNSCKKRGTPCHFGLNKRRAGRAHSAHHYGTSQLESAQSAALPSGSSNEGRTCTFSSEMNVGALDPFTGRTEKQRQEQYHVPLYIDRLLEDKRTPERRRGESSLLKAHDQYVGSSGIAFFSDRKIASISDRLGHKKLWDLLEALSNAISSRINHNSRSTATTIEFNAPSSNLEIIEESVKLYITTYFDQVHPIYPFLNRRGFEDQVFNTDRTQLLQDSPSFSALYHSVLALGSQYHSISSFEPGIGNTWKLYQVALGLFPKLLVTRGGLLHIQALTAMAIFARNSSCVQIGYLLTTEAARMVQFVGLSRAIYDTENIAECHRVFWVIYILEKTLSFACGRASILIDSEIGTPVPEVPEATIGNFNWFHAMCQFSRLISKAHTTLFSISATMVPANQLKAAIDASNADLEGWKMSIPEDFRPSSCVDRLNTLDRKTVAITLILHYNYYSAVIAHARLSLSILERESLRPTTELEALLNACTTIIGLTKYIDIATYTPVWILLSVPLSALFILFDLVIHNPAHEKTRANLSLLGIAAGYFCSLEYASGGTLQTSLLSDIAHIARDYIYNIDRGIVARTTGSVPEDGDPLQLNAFRDEPQTPLSISQGASTLLEEMFPVHNSTENPNYPTNNFVLPAGIGLPEGIDLMDFFTTSIQYG